MMLRGDVDFNRQTFLYWLFIGCFFSYCGLLSHRSNNLLWSNSLYLQWFLLFAEFQFMNMENKKEEPTLNKVTFVNGVQIKNKSGKH